MTVPRSVADVLADHVTLEVESIDRMYCNLRTHLAPLLGTTADTMTAGQLSYHLRRLRHHRLVERVPGTHRYTIPDRGLHLALFLTRTHGRVLRPGLSDILDPHAIPTPIKRQLDRFTTAADDYARKQSLLGNT
jgi:hypothetical protein